MTLATRGGNSARRANLAICWRWARAREGAPLGSFLIKTCVWLSVRTVTMEIYNPPGVRLAHPTAKGVMTVPPVGNVQMVTMSTRGSVCLTVVMGCLVLGRHLTD